MRNRKLIMTCECAMMIALAFALSFAKLWRMPLGGSVTLASMLPIMLISVKYGTRVGVSTAFLYSFAQLVQAFMQGDLSWAMDFSVFVVCVLFDYVIPYTVIGISGIFRKRGEVFIYLGMALAVALRFLCHYLTGVTIWKQWVKEGWSVWIYSLAYNGGYLLPDLAILLAVAIIILRVPQMRKILNLK